MALTRGDLNQTYKIVSICSLLTQCISQQQIENPSTSQTIQIHSQFNMFDLDLTKNISENFSKRGFVSTAKASLTKVITLKIKYFF